MTRESHQFRNTLTATLVVTSCYPVSTFIEIHICVKSVSCMCVCAIPQGRPLIQSDRGINTIPNLIDPLQNHSIILHH